MGTADAWIRRRCLTEGGAVRLVSERYGGRTTLCWRTEDTQWASLDANMARCARRATQQRREAAEALAAVDVGEVESHSLAPRTIHGCEHRNRVMVDIVSSQKGSVIDLTSIGTVRVTGSDEEE
ncbi:putative methyltransferase PMT17 [Hordeum vulgare]|nr:putative methyltransferase PMT17 [Hordeum vulgare]